MDDQKQIILDFLKTQIHGVVSTLDSKSNNPESAVVAFSETEELELIFGTFNDTRKFKNIENNLQVSFVVFTDEITVQYEGSAKLVEGNEETEVRNIHLNKNPSSQKYAFHEKQRYFKITPKWIRYSDFSFDSEKVFEISL